MPLAGKIMAMVFQDLEKDFRPWTTCHTRQLVTGDTYTAVLQSLKGGHQEKQHEKVTKTRADDNMCPASA